VLNFGMLSENVTFGHKVEKKQQ